MLRGSADRAGAAVRVRGAERAAEDAASPALGGGRSSATLPARQIERDRNCGRYWQFPVATRPVAEFARSRRTHEIWGLNPRFPRSPHRLALPQTWCRKPGAAIRGEGTGSGGNRISSPIGIRVGSRATVGNPGGEAARRPLFCGAVADFDSTQSGGLHFRSVKNGANGGFRWLPRPTSTR
jgi:hypothetical protein